ncbi:uncharacterized protein V1510DRAFT_403877 [Dipodascopsis tothii]|uniref:uncharacterized protein n=1 Tax=Dipodascopsis tothii TaxID=44089 RepID=UPI0034CE5884
MDGGDTLRGNSIVCVRAGEAIVAVRAVAGDGPALALTATDGEFVYTAKVDNAGLASARAERSAQSDAEWIDTVAGGFRLGPPRDVGVVVEAVMDAGKSVDLVFRRVVHGVTTRLGALPLAVDYDIELSLLDWLLDATAATAGLWTELAGAKAATAAATAARGRLETEMAELAEAKAVHDREVLARALRLVNSKKARIRELEGRAGAARAAGWPVQAPAAGLSDDSDDGFAASPLETPRKRRRVAGGASSGGEVSDEPATPSRSTIARTLERHSVTPEKGVPRTRGRAAVRANVVRSGRRP